LAQSTFAALASLSDILTIAPRFPRVGFSERDDADRFAAPGECGEEDPAFDFPERVDTDFAIVLPPVLPFEPGLIEKANRSRKGQAARVRFSRS